MFSNTTAELSLNIPSKCINSIPNDTSNHRFIVGTCASSSSSSSSSSSHRVPSNSLYLLRYHEEMNEIAVDAQLDFGNDEGCGEIWSMSSCPMDKTLVITCRSTNDNTSGSRCETALWHIPEKSMKEDEIDFYTEDDRNIGGVGGSSQGMEENDRNYSSDINETLEKVCVLTDDDQRNYNESSSAILKGRVSDMQWNPECLPNMDEGSLGGINFVTVDYCIDGSPTLTTWDMNTSSVIPVSRLSITSSESKTVMNAITVPNPPKCSWDPHNTNLCAVTTGPSVAIVDNRTSQIELTLKQCHKFGVTDLDHNPNKPNILSTCGQDSLVKFWDLRYTMSSSTAFDDLTNKGSSSSLGKKYHPLRILQGGHTHWIPRIQYNSFHDQLLLSGGSDGIVNLWRISSISSAPLLDLGSTSNNNVDMDNKNIDMNTDFSNFDDDEEEENLRKALNDDTEDLSFAGQQNLGQSTNQNGDSDGMNAPDIRVAKMEMRDAVYDLDWSAADPWIYVTLSYDGNVVLNHVPSKEKYKILL